jgi:hypothetical protein
MSWSIVKAGKVQSILPALEKDFSSLSITGVLEKEIAADVHSVIKKALGGFKDNAAVTVSASGSAYTSGTESISQTVKVSVEPIYGFVE